MDGEDTQLEDDDGDKEAKEFETELDMSLID